MKIGRYELSRSRQDGSALMAVAMFVLSPAVVAKNESSRRAQRIELAARALSSYRRWQEDPYR